MKKALFVFMVIISSTAFSGEISPGEKMMIAFGIDKVLESQKKAYESDAHNQVDIVMKQLESTLFKLPVETSEEIEEIMNSLVDSLFDSWSVETAIEIYAEEWNKNYTPSEIEDVIEKYEDPAAKKELEVVLAASEALNKYISGSYSAALEKSMAELLPKVQQAIIRGRQKVQSN